MEWAWGYYQYDSSIRRKAWECVSIFQWARKHSSFRWPVMDPRGPSTTFHDVLECSMTWPWSILEKVQVPLKYVPWFKEAEFTPAVLRGKTLNTANTYVSYSCEGLRKHPSWAFGNTCSSQGTPQNWGTRRTAAPAGSRKLPATLNAASYINTVSRPTWEAHTTGEQMNHATTMICGPPRLEAADWILLSQLSQISLLCSSPPPLIPPTLPPSPYTPSDWTVGIVPVLRA